MVEIPDELIATHVIKQAREYGTFGDVNDTAALGEYGQVSKETEWSLSDITPEECYVDMYDDNVVVTDTIEAEYTVQTRKAKYNPPGKAHPAEYERKTVELRIEISMTLGELPEPVINAEII